MFSPWLSLGQNYHIYTYEVAIRDDEEAIWIQISGDYVLRMLIVCFFLFVYLNV